MTHRIARRRGITLGQTLFLIGLVGVGLVLVSTVVSRPYRQRGQNIAQEARDLLARQNVTPLTGELQQLLDESQVKAIATQSHELIGKRAPEFSLVDHHGQALSLSQLVADGPVVAVFYYGYYCDHCVSQLFALDQDLARFQELGARVVAISADAPQETLEKMAEYGEFHFPVLSDAGNKVAEQYSVFQAASSSKSESLKHGTFVIGRDGVVRWCQTGPEPFTDNATLLVEIAKLEGRLSPPSDASPETPNLPNLKTGN